MLLSIPYPEINPVFFSLGPLPIRWYALAYIAGITLGFIYVTRLLKNTRLWQGAAMDGSGKDATASPPITRIQLDDLVFWVTLGVILGGRFGYVLFYKPELLTAAWVSVHKMMGGGDGLIQTLLGWIHIPPALMIWEGGMSFHGGLIGVTLAGFLYCRKNKLEALRVGDLFAVCVPIGLFFGRVANFINAELVGRPSDAPWAMVFPQYFDHAAGQWVYAVDAVARHPSQLYEAALEGLVLFIILRIATHSYGILSRPGAAIGIFLAGYGTARTIVENFRAPDAGMPDFPLGLTMGMMLSIPMIALGAWLIARAYGVFTPKPSSSST